MESLSNNKLQIGGRGKFKKLTMEGSMEYINKVMEEFKDDKETAMTFLHLLKEFKENRVTVDEVISRVVLLFKEHDNLLAEFRAFIPEASLRPSLQSPTYNDARTFVQKIMGRYENNKQVYDQFLDIMNRCRRENMSLETAKQEVATLFHGNDDLIEEFLKYVQPGVPLAER